MIEWLVQKKIFRNANHAIWFLCSLGFLLVLISQSLGVNQRIMFLLVPAVIHLPPLITSINVNYLKKRNSEIYSKDCIWFNAVMIIIYLILFIF